MIELDTKIYIILLTNIILINLIKNKVKYLKQYLAYSIHLINVNSFSYLDLCRNIMGKVKLIIFCVAQSLGLDF